MSYAVNVFYLTKLKRFPNISEKRMTPSEKTIHVACRWKLQVDETNIDSGSFQQGFVQGLSIT